MPVTWKLLESMVWVINFFIRWKLGRKCHAQYLKSLWSKAEFVTYKAFKLRAWNVLPNLYAIVKVDNFCYAFQKLSSYGHETSNLIYVQK